MYLLVGWPLLIFEKKSCFFIGVGKYFIAGGLRTV